MQVLGSIGALFEAVVIVPANPIPKAEEAGLLVVNDLRVERVAFIAPTAASLINPP
jgi:hypothetical protein